MWSNEATYKWIKFLLVHETEFWDEIEEVFVAGVNMGLLHITILYILINNYNKVNSYVLPKNKKSLSATKNNCNFLCMHYV